MGQILSDLRANTLDCIDIDMESFGYSMKLIMIK
jgi:hypothetical protein